MSPPRGGCRTAGLPASEAAGTITIDVAAKLLMVTPEWVRRLTKEGWIAKTDRGRYRVVDVVQGYIRFLKDEARRATKTASHTRLQDIRACKEELAVAQTERELVPLADAMTLVDEVAGAVVARVNAIPARFTRNIEQRAALPREVDEALAEVADRIGKLGHAFRSGQARMILRPTRKRPPDQWARENRVYPLSSGRPGPKDPALTPYMIPFMRAFDDPN